MFRPQTVIIRPYNNLSQIVLYTYWKYIHIHLLYAGTTIDGKPEFLIPTSDQEDVIQRRLYTIYAHSLKDFQFLTSPTQLTHFDVANYVQFPRDKH
jgi:hypothetical protein